jgi:hypothetical protein
MDFKTAIVHSAITRAQPIVLTGLAAMLGAFFILDDPIFNGLAISLIFGISVSTVLTLVVIPILYYVAYRHRLEREVLPAPRWPLLALALAVFVPPPAAADLLASLARRTFSPRQGAMRSAACGPRRGPELGASRPRRCGSPASRPDRLASGSSTHETEAQGAQFSAPGFGTVRTASGFCHLSDARAPLHAGPSTAAMPLYNPERRARQRQLNLSVDARRPRVAELPRKD